MPDTATHSQAITLLPFDSRVLTELANAIIERHHHTLPDLSRVVIMLANPACAAQMRKALLTAASKNNCHALLGPHISSLRLWIESRQASTHNKISQHERELILVEALRKYPQLPGANQPWLLAENLLTLFDELNRQHVHISSDQSEFTRQLRKAYGITVENNSELLTHLDRESHLVHQLWQAWHKQLDDMQAEDALGIYHHKLQASLNDNNDTYEYWLAGYTRLEAGEQQWFDARAKQDRAKLYKSVSAVEAGSAASDFSTFIGQVYNSATNDFASRAGKTCKQIPTSPLQERIRIIHADNEEQEACAIELQVRRWLCSGRRNIGIVTQDRRLARRVRALLDRASISLQDSAGWALSTTSAAAALERWLECIEQEFEHVALLDLLKSSFVFTAEHGGQYLQTVYRFEQDIVLHENIASGLHRYQRALESRQQRLGKIWSQQTFAAVKEMLDVLEKAARPLLPFTDNREHDPGDFIRGLYKSLEKIGMLSALQDDPAGQRVLQELDNLLAAISRQPMKMRWPELRSWLGRTLERFSFKPATTDNRVTLVDLQQSHLMQFDAVILAGADKNHLPGQIRQQAFFNDAVRYSLGLASSEQHLDDNFYYYQCLIHSAPEVIVSHHLNSSNGETTILSPWIEALANFHRIAYGTDLAATELASISGNMHTAMINDQRIGLPEGDTRPAPETPVQLLPEQLSASSYQQLIDCPYRFFAARILRLSASDEITEVLSKTDYGERVHRCLEAFHGNVDKYPGPFAEKVTAVNRSAAVGLLEEIAKSVFAADLEDNFEHRGWLQRFIELIPAYIEWQISHAQQWDTQFTEAQAEINHPDLKLILKGRLDRVDHGGLGLDIIDYKTGYTPKQGDVDSGEAVQLPFYALLSNEKVQRVEYLKLDQATAKTAACLEGDALADLVEKNVLRLKSLETALSTRARLPAWGDSSVCKYCDASGLCRRDNWLNKGEPS